MRGTASIRKDLFGCGIPASLNFLIFRLLKRLFHFNSKPIRFIERFYRKKIHLRLDPLEDFFYPDLKSSHRVPTGICFFEGWAFRMHRTFQKHHAEIRKLFRFSESLENSSKAVLSIAPDKIKIGVHIRMGDYKKLAPQWVYPLEFWHEAMKNIQSKCSDRASFFVVSDDGDIDFPENWIVRHRGSYQTDMALLSECDFVLGPPSTFNRWAAFVGGKPHYCAWNSNEFPYLDKFHNFKLSSDSFFELTDDEKEAVRWFGIT